MNAEQVHEAWVVLDNLNDGSLDNVRGELFIVNDKGAAMAAVHREVHDKEWILREVYE